MTYDFNTYPLKLALLLGGKDIEDMLKFEDEEMEVGTWRGQKLYSKVIRDFSSTQVTSAGVTLTFPEDFNPDIIISIFGYGGLGSGRRMLLDSSYFEYTASTKQFTMKNSYHTIYGMVLAFFYTKAED